MYQFAEHGENSDAYKAFIDYMNHMKKSDLCFAKCFTRKFIESFWPSRGMNHLQNLSLAMGGHRPEPVVRAESYAEAYAADNNLRLDRTLEGDYIFMKLQQE